MEMRYPVHQNQVKRMTTDELRANFLVSDTSSRKTMSAVLTY